MNTQPLSPAESELASRMVSDYDAAVRAAAENRARAMRAIALSHNIEGPDWTIKRNDDGAWCIEVDGEQPETAMAVTDGETPSIAPGKANRMARLLGNG